MLHGFLCQRNSIGKKGFITNSKSLSFHRRKYTDKSEITPFLNTSSTMSPTIPNHSGGTTATVNRTLLHHQQINTLGSVGAHKNGTTGALRGFAINSSSESPPPDYNMVHDTKRHAIHFIYFMFSLSSIQFVHV